MDLGITISGGEACFNGFRHIAPAHPLVSGTWKATSHEEKLAWQSAAQNAVRNLIGDDLIVTPLVLPGMPSNFSYDTPEDLDYDDVETDGYDSQ